MSRKAVVLLAGLMVVLTGTVLQGRAQERERITSDTAAFAEVVDIRGNGWMYGLYWQGDSIIAATPRGIWEMSADGTLVSPTRIYEPAIEDTATRYAAFSETRYAIANFNKVIVVDTAGQFIGQMTQETSGLAGERFADIRELQLSADGELLVVIWRMNGESISANDTVITLHETTANLPQIDTIRLTDYDPGYAVLHEDVLAVAGSVGNDTTLQLIDITTGETRWAVTDDNSNDLLAVSESAAFSPDGSLLAVLGTGRISILDTSDGTVVDRIRRSLPDSFESGFISPSSVVFLDNEGTVAFVESRGFPSSATRFSPRVGYVNVRDSATGAIQSVATTDGFYNHIVTNADRTQIVSGGYAGDLLRLDVSDPSAPVEQGILAAGFVASSDIVSPGPGGSIYTGGFDGAVRRWDVDGRVISTSMAFSRIYDVVPLEDTVLVLNEFRAHLLDRFSFERLHQYPEWSVSGFVQSSATTITKEGLVRFAAHQSESGTILWEFDGISVDLQPVPDINSADAMAFSPRSSRLVITARNFETGTQELIFFDRFDEIARLSFDVEVGALLYLDVKFGTTDDVVYLFASDCAWIEAEIEYPTGTSAGSISIRSEVPPSDEAGVFCENPTISPVDADLVALSDGQDVSLRSLATGEEWSSLVASNWLVTDLEFSPDGTQLFVGGFDGTIRTIEVVR